MSRRLLLFSMAASVALLVIFHLFGGDDGILRAQDEAVRDPAVVLSMSGPLQNETLNVDSGVAPLPKETSTDQNLFLTKVRMPHERADDLFTLAFEAGNSSDPVDLEAGFHAAMLCNTVKADWDILEPITNGAGGDKKREYSSKQISARCRGFLDGDPSGNHSIRRRLQEIGKLNPEVYMPSPSNSGLSTEQFYAAMVRQDWTVLAFGSDKLIPRALAVAGNLSMADKAAFAIAFVLAPCELGSDCGPESISYHYECARFARCFGSMEQIYLTLTKDATKPELVEKYKTQIVRAWRAKNRTFFGM